MWKICLKICDITKFEVNSLLMLLVMLLQVCLCLLLYTYFCYAYFRGYACLYCQRSEKSQLLLLYTVYCLCLHILSKKSQLLLQCKLFSGCACLYCQRSLNCFYNALLFSAYACFCLYCQRSLNCFYNAYTV